MKDNKTKTIKRPYTALDKAIAWAEKQDANPVKLNLKAIRVKAFLAGHQATLLEVAEILDVLGESIQ
jgi:hypothetical protein